MARGAHYNSSLRFTAEQKNIIAVVVSSDRPVSIINRGIEMNALHEWGPLPDNPLKTETLKEHFEGYFNE